MTDRTLLDHYRHQYVEACKWNARLLFAFLALVVVDAGLLLWWLGSQK